MISEFIPSLSIQDSIKKIELLPKRLDIILSNNFLATSI